MVIKETLIDWKYYTCGANGQIYSYYWKKYLSGNITKYGYVVVLLKCTDGKQRIFRWHRVIWTFFYGIIPEGMQVNHIDENKQNNTLSNLNLMTPKENCNWGTRTERIVAKHIGIPRTEEWKTKVRGRKRTEEQKAKIGKALSKPVVAIDDDGNVVYEFASTQEAERYGFCHSAVSQCCNKCFHRQGNNYYKGYRWYYKEDYLNEKESERC